VIETGTHSAEAQARSMQSRAMRREEKPEDLVGSVVFLSSADSDFITGQTIAVDGGSVNT
jgi:NAD(P)-dependent dehydrogenase (short-subunit alcohol dehydrogenase family)